MSTRCACAATAVLALFAVIHVLATELDTGDGLSVTISDTDGSVAAVTIGGEPVPLTPGEFGGASVQIGAPLPQSLMLELNFEADGGPWTAARNADWESAGPYVTWLPDDGIDGSAHVLLGDGVTTGAGMALAAPVAVIDGSTVRISWRARSASVETTQILCVRVFDAAGQDITSTVVAPPGWSWTSTSQAHAAWGIHCVEPDAWETFDRHYLVPSEAASIRVSLRHWTGGDHLVHIDELKLDVVGGIQWGERTAVLGPLSPIPNGVRQTVELPGQDLRIEADTIAQSGSLRIELRAEDFAAGAEDRPILLYWTLPVAAQGWSWWDDIDTPHVIGPDEVLANTFQLALHDVSFYPFSSITSGQFGLGLGVPMNEPVVQRFEYDPAHGLQSVWEIALSPLTTKLGPGRAAVSVSLYHHEPTWGFRAATDKYYTLFPDFFIKRTTREGAWMYPIPPSQIPDPADFGFAYFETRPLDEAERALCDQLGIGIFHYVEPWLAWQYWGNSSEKPPYEDRVAVLEGWAAAPSRFATWLPDDGIDDSAHLLLGDGMTSGAGMATSNAFPVPGGDTVTITWQARTASLATTQILCVRLYDAVGKDITATIVAPAGWFWSSVSEAHVVAGIANTGVGLWEPFASVYALPPGAAAMRVSLRHWNGGDHLVHIDDLRVESTNDAATYLFMPFDADDGSCLSALNANWEGGEATWLRAPRQQAAQAVLNSSPLDVDGRYLIDSDPYLWHEWAPDSWNQAWPTNPDPDHAPPNAFDLYREHWVLHRIDEADGMYIDSVSAGEGSWSGWENHRAEHLAVTDSPLTFSWIDGGAAQLAPQAQAEFLTPIAAELRGQGRLMMLNLFPKGTRFHAHNADTMGSEIMQLVEDNRWSRLRRTLARRRIVSNLLQWGWDSPIYATYDQMEEFIRGQLFWGFYPAVSSAGGMLSGGTPDRYFLHPELYERDRPLFTLYMPVIAALSSAGWEPVTYATAVPAAEIERFGDFSHGRVLLTVRGPQGGAVQTEVTLDLAACGLASASTPLEATDLLAGTCVAIELLSDPLRARFFASLDAGEVGVYAIALEGPVPGDIDQDGDVDLADYGVFALCVSGPDGDSPPMGCTQAQFDLSDLDGDADADLQDFAVFLDTFRTAP